MKRFIITALIAGGMISFGAAAAQGAHTCNVSAVTSPATGSFVRGTTTIAWTAGGHCDATNMFTVQAGPSGSLATLTTTATVAPDKTGQFSWATDVLADGSTYEVKVVLGTSSKNTTAITVDNTAPVITLAARTPANANGWNNTAVTVEWSCSDAFVVSASASATLSLEGAGQEAAGGCTDLAGNTASDTQDDINIDLTAPVLGFMGRTEPNAAGWNNTSVSLSWSCTDAVSGTSSSELTATITSEGVAQGALAICTDLAGNSVGNTQSDIDIDLTDPAIALTVRTEANGSGWNAGPVSLEWSCSDELSGPAAAGDAATVVTDGAGQSATGTCTDVAGNTVSDTQSDINIDQTAPAFGSIARTAPNAAGWNKDDVTVTWGCGDALSGPVAPSLSQTVTTEGANLSATAICSDVAGNSVSNTVSAINIDTTAPIATVNQASTLDAIVLPGGVITGAALDTLSGVAEVDVTFTDLLGNSTTRAAILDGSTWSVSTEGLAPGPHTVVAHPTDVADNQGEPTAPATFIKTL